GILATRAQAIADHTLQAGLWDRLLQLRMSFFRRFSAGDLKTRATAVYQIREKLGGTTLRSLLGGVASVLNLALLLYYSPKLSLIAIAIAAVNLGATTFAAVAILGRDRELVALRGSLLGLVVQLVNGVSKLRLAGAERRAFAHWAHRFARQQRLALDVKAIQDRLAVLNGATSFASAALLFYATADLVFQRPAPGALAAAAPLTTGAFLAFNSAFGAFLACAASLSETVTSALEVVNLGERAAPILEEPPEVDLAKTDPGRLRGKIALERVTFRYRGAGAPTLDEVTIRAEPGEFIAFVGESGSGKSTILRLLLGFETPASGGIYFDDQDASKLDMNAVRRQLGVVLQTGRISAGSIHDNVSGGALVTLEEVSEAARNAGLEDDIAAMPMGLHTVISEGGTNLSGGQRQRLLIARAIVLKPRILLFDEATSALDNRTQAKVSESLDRLQATRIVIAHRLSTIRKADRIYVLERGKVVQVGSYDELAKQEGGIFERLVARQTA
ncbi:MAG TPA: ATP-binding cassette domain-containing protein, partial [Planctomycetota bacterium]|nr:ATP-binding cassette domain-containing protein [Planctomycetota bacterium]